MNRVFVTAAFCIVSFIACAQTKSNIDFETYNPPSSLVVPQHVVTKAKFPFIDVHNHQGNMSPQALTGLAKVMDTLNMAAMVNLSGSNGDKLKQSVENIKANHPQ